MRSDTLTDMVAHMKDTVGLVHQMPFVCDRPGLPSTLEQVGSLTSMSMMRIDGHGRSSVIMLKGKYVVTTPLLSRKCKILLSPLSWTLV